MGWKPKPKKEEPKFEPIEDSEDVTEKHSIKSEDRKEKIQMVTEQQLIVNQQNYIISMLEYNKKILDYLKEKIDEE